MCRHKIGLSYSNRIGCKLDKTVAEEMHTLWQWPDPFARERNETMHIANKITMIVARVEMVDSTHHLPISAVDAACIAHHQIADFLAVYDLLHRQSHGVPFPFF